LDTTALEKVWQEAQALSPEEQRQLLHRLGKIALPTEGHDADYDLQRYLYEAGLLSEIKPPIKDVATYSNRMPVTSRGKSASELIVEERR